MRAAVVLALAVGVVTAMGGVGTHAPSAPKARPPRILYASDWSGSSEIYAVDPASGRRGQLTFGRAPACVPANPCGYVRPIPSPDGRRIVFGDHSIEGPLPGSLFVARADGRGRRRFAQGVDLFYSDAVWSRDARRIAYAERDGLHVVNGDGIGARLVDRGQDSDAAWSPDSRSLAFVRRAAAANELVVTRSGVEHVVGESSLSADLRFAWSPTGRWFAYNSTPSIASNPGELDLVRPDGSGRRRLVVSPTTDFAWSPDGRWLAYSSSSLNVLDLVRPDGSGRRQLFNASVGGLAWSADARSLAFCCHNGLLVEDVATGSMHLLPSYSGGFFSWSPRGHLLAFSASEGIRVRDAAGRTRRITRDRPFLELWSPDGNSIAYTTSSSTSPENYLRVTSVSGRVRTLFSSSGAYGGMLWGFTWTQPSLGVRYRRTAPRTLATVSQQELQAPWPIERLAADGDRVAYVACGHVFVWTPSARAVVQAEPVASIAPNCRGPSYATNYSVYDLALAGERVAYGSVDGGNVRRWWLGGTELGRAPSYFTLGRTRS
jgi:Tol biopolymer transport system component